MSKFKHHVSFSHHDHATPNGDVVNDSSRPASVPGKSSPLPDYPLVEDHNHTATVAAGRLPEEIYTNTLPRWRATLRRKCVSVVELESEVIGKWQVRFRFLRAPFLAMHGMRTLSSFSFLLESHSVAMARHLFFANLDARHTYVLSRLSAHIFLLGIWRARKRVRHECFKTFFFQPFPLGGTLISFIRFFLSGFAMPWPLACICLHSSKIWYALRDPMPRR
jgi:hypothetical protein